MNALDVSGQPMPLNKCRRALVTLEPLDFQMSPHVMLIQLALRGENPVAVITLVLCLCYPMSPFHVNNEATQATAYF